MRDTSSSLRGVPSGLRGVPADLALVADGFRHQRGKLTDRQVRAGADVDGLRLVVVLQQVQASAREIVDMEELSSRAPVPHKVTAGSWPTLASWKRRIMAGRTCEVSRSKLSPGPYRFVGMAEMKCLSY